MLKYVRRSRLYFDIGRRSGRSTSHLVAIMLRLVRALDRDAEVVCLCLA